MNIWLIEVLAGMCLLIGVQYGIKKIILNYKSKGKALEIAYLPLSILLWIVGFVYVIDIISDHFGLMKAVGYMMVLRRAATVACLAWLFFRWKNSFQKSILLDKTKKVDEGTVHAIGRLSTIAIIILSGLVILQIFGLNIAPLVAFGSIGAASLGFAGKDVIANLCSGLMLNITRPFVVGDYIMLPEKGLDGHIEEVGWFKTSLRDKEKRAVYLPNNYFSTQVVVNITRMTHRHFKQCIMIPFASLSEVEALSEIIRAILREHPKIDAKAPIYVHLNKFGDSAAEFEVEAYSTETDQDGFYCVQQEILLLIYRELEKKSIALAIPALKLHGSSAFLELQQLSKR